MMRVFVLAASVLLSVAAAKAEPGALKVHGDWVVGCDNTLSCMAVYLIATDPARGEAGDGIVSMVIRRGGEGGANAKIDVQFAIQARYIDPANALPRVNENYGFSIQLGDPHVLDLLGLGGKPQATVSLKGLHAALAQMDERQGRTDGPSALVSRGKRATPLPPLPRAPVVVRPPASDAPPRQLADTELDALRSRHFSHCRRNHHAPTYKPSAHFHRLDAASTLVLLEPPCLGGGYNREQLALVIDETGTVRKPDFEFPMDRDVRNMLVNPWWDEKGRSLGSHAKGRGQGDCGTVQSYVWDGRSFRLVLQEDMSPCKGVFTFIRTWHAEVRDR
jgi:hypothetical protein